MTSYALVSETRAYNFVNSSCIRVDVGTDTKVKSFTVHENLITRRSAFFANAMVHDWKEASERVVRLPENEPEVFSLYLNYLYASVMPIVPDMKESTETGAGKHDHEDYDRERGEEYGETIAGKQVQDRYLALSKLYVLAEQLLDETTKSAVLDALAAQVEETNCPSLPNGDSVWVIYRGTTEANKARQWLTGLYVNYGHTCGLGPRELESTEFVADVANGLLANRIKPWLKEHLKDQLQDAEVKLTEMTKENVAAKQLMLFKEARITVLEKKVKKLEKLMRQT